MKKLILAALLLFAIGAEAQCTPANNCVNIQTLPGGTGSTVTQTNPQNLKATVTQDVTALNGVIDPCLSPNVAKSSFSIAIASAATTQVIAPSGATKVHLCAITLTYTSGTTPTVKLISGTGAICDTGTVTLTGVMSVPATVGGGITVGYGGSLFGSAIVAGQGLCIVSAGTTPNLNGFATYVQQ